MDFEVLFRDLNLNIDLGDIRIKAIDEKHGVFIHSFPRHMHSFYELHYIVGGEGKLILDHSEYELSKGKLFLLGPKVHHAQLTNTRNCMEEYCFSFDIQPKKLEKSSTMTNFFTDSDFYICDDTRNIVSLFSEIEQELNSREIGYTEAIRSLLERVMILTVRNFLYKSSEMSVAKTVPDDRRSLLMDEAFLFSYKTLTLESLSKLLNLSLRQTERLIYDKYGTSFVKMRTQSRLNAAMNMLSDSEMPLSEIAEKCGFSSYTHFFNVFKATYQTAPSEYRKQKTEVKIE